MAVCAAPFRQSEDDVEKIIVLDVVNHERVARGDDDVSLIFGDLYVQWKCERLYVEVTAGFEWRIRVDPHASPDLIRFDVNQVKAICGRGVNNILLACYV